MSEAFQFAAVILAAGGSRRMGQPKLLLPWGNSSILGHLLEQWRNLGAAQTGIVCAPDHEPLELELQRLGFSKSECIYNPEPQAGMFRSVQCAAAWRGWQSGLTHWVMALGDQPHVRAGTLGRLLEFARANASRVSQPTLHGRPRHPVILPKPIFQALETTKCSTLREFLSLQCVAGCEIDDPGLDLDIDRPEDYRRALDLRAKES